MHIAFTNVQIPANQKNSTQKKILPQKEKKKPVNFWCKENDIPPPPPKKNVQSCGKIKCNILRAEV